jgi:Tol biopolymer transport system component
MRPTPRILLACLIVTGSAAAQVTRRESLSFANAQAGQNSGTPSISADGRYIAFESDATNMILGDTNGSSDVFVRDAWCARRGA